ncbi:histone deacetylase family protein [Oceanibacterium hippocampi]|uniref:Histone deacetylase-like amidohydrolase n=1 Tax=Oceanibacterium hippocampi TaxID=745714 RepID=A0A1Y5TUG6_9PROT|nr:histone deacetylase family protein [Oceanibacterium hippocampi]SLN72908.1 Histone deacetylase-like amidohydrolase [Oceanibacterium hippocampi]
MTTLLISHTDCLYHDTGDGHPERPDRLRAILHALDEEAFPDLLRREAPLATREQLARVHDDAYLDTLIARAPERGTIYLDPDTVMSPGSLSAALRAAGAVCAAVDAVLAGEVTNAFCAVRPPGHHAEPHQAMGFCLFNNVAVGAAHARAQHGIAKIAIVDFDVHHGNGTQAAFLDDPQTFFASCHQWPLYPGTGREQDLGKGPLVNVCLPPFADGAAFRARMEERVLPELDLFRPDLVMISAGFDAHVNDPLANLNYEDDDYRWITEQLMTISDGRIVSTLEGGYDLGALASAGAAHVRALMAA